MAKSLIIFGAGKGAELLIDYFKCECERVRIAGLVDDNATGEVMGCPILGTSETVAQYDPDKFKAIISVSSPSLRHKWWNMFASFEFIGAELSGWPANTKVGAGNVVFPGVTIDRFSSIGHNNVISAGTYIAHHCKVGSHNLFGPGVHLSGLVTIGSGCSFGAGVMIEPYVTIGDRCSIASGTVVVRDVPCDTRILGRIALTQHGVYQGERIVR